VQQCAEIKLQKASLIKYSSILSEVLASLQVAYRIPPYKKSLTIEDDLILPTATDIVTTVLGQSRATQLVGILLSSDTCVPTNLRQLIEKINHFLF
jgi:hypothetical protein